MYRIPFNEKAGVCPFRIKTGHFFQKETTPNGVVFLFGGPGGSNYKMRMSGEHSLAAGLDGGNIFWMQLRYLDTVWHL